MHSNKSSALRVIYAERGNPVRLHIEEARVHACQVDVHGSLSPARRVVTRVRRSHASLQGCNARGWRVCTGLPTNQAHVHGDISVVH